MTREEFTLFIDKLEQKYPVNEWQIDKVKIWPLIKIRLSFSFHSNPELRNEGSESESTIIKLKKASKGFFQYIKLLFQKQRTIPTKLFCLAPHFRYYDGKQYVNRYYNQLIKQSKNDNQGFLLGEYGNTTKEYRDKLDFPHQTIYFENYKYLALVLRELTWKQKLRNAHWPCFKEFLFEVNDVLQSSTSLSQITLLKQMVYILELKKIYKEVLLKYNIVDTYILCYYVSEMYAMTLATAELIIPSWDIQHGGQGNLHQAYSGFNKIPPSGYKLLPKKFWVWDKASALEISKWISRQEFHEVEVKGNPWIEYCTQRYKAEIKSSKKIILYTMQPIGDHLLDPYLVETIIKTPSDYIWWLRLHPRQIHKKNKLIDLLRVNSLMDRVNIEEAINLPLPAILSQTYIHLSKFSGSILEASLLNVKSIILDPVGVESFPDLISNGKGVAVLTQNSNDLIETILKLEN